MKKDLNEIAKIEKAIKDKYGVDAVKHPKKDWTDEKEKAYIEQMKEFYKKLEKREKDSPPTQAAGFIIKQAKTSRSTNRTCPVCNSYSFDPADDMYFTKYECCFECYVQYVDGREQRWLSGWRPNNTRGFSK